MIHETLRVVAEEEGREALWNLSDIKEVFGLDPKKRPSGIAAQDMRLCVGRLAWRR